MNAAKDTQTITKVRLVTMLSGKRLQAAVCGGVLMGLTACGGGSGGSAEQGPVVDPLATYDVNLGRCLTTYSSAPDAHALLLDSEGVLVEFVGGSLVPSLLADVCFTEGKVVAVDIRPSSELAKEAAAGDSTVTLSAVDYFAAGGSNGGFMIGARITIGAGTARAESRTITALVPFTLDHPLDYPHAVDEVVIDTGLS